VEKVQIRGGPHPHPLQRIVQTKKKHSMAVTKGANPKKQRKNDKNFYWRQKDKIYVFWAKVTRFLYRFWLF
jgi:hypothetical protein